MRITSTLRSPILVVLTSALSIGIGACAGSGSSTGSGGESGGGTGGTLSGGQGGAGAGSGGTTGVAGSGSGAGGASAGGQAGTAAGTGGMAETGGHAGGTTGSGGTGSGFTPYACKGTFASPTSFPAGSSATQIAGAPPADAFNGNGYNFETIEGPVWINDALYVSEFGSMTMPPPSRILKIDESDTVTIAFPSIADTGSNGLAVDGNGNIVSANHGVGGIVEFALPSGAMTTLTSAYMGARFDSPNDLTIRSDGTIYFTDYCCYQTPSPPPQGNGNTRAYMLTPGSSTATALFTDTNGGGPNGITLSLDESTLYVGDGSGVMKYSVNSNGSIGATGTAFDPTDLGNQNTDGMAIDCAGDLYVVRVNQHDIIVVNPAGATIGDISGFPNAAEVTNLAFGGSDHETLYVTAQGEGVQRGVFKLKLSVPGMPY
jgi:gluconolactonase